MTDEELEALNKQILVLRSRYKDDWRLSEILNLLHNQIMNLRKPHSPIELQELMMATLRGLVRALAGGGQLLHEPGKN